MNPTARSRSPTCLPAAIGLEEDGWRPLGAGVSRLGSGGATFTLQGLHALGLSWEADDFIQFVADLARTSDGSSYDAHANQNLAGNLRRVEQ